MAKTRNNPALARQKHLLSETEHIFVDLLF